MTVLYEATRCDDSALRDRMKAIANERRRFGYRPIHVLLDKDGEERRVYSLGVGETFGHMSLLTGAPRLASVRAASHLVVAEFHKSTLVPILAANPSLIDPVADEIVRIEAKRRELLDGDTGAVAIVPADHGLLDQLSGRIRRFFSPHSGE
jgi:CRP-like cAMP-binding protein